MKDASSIDTENEQMMKETTKDVYFLSFSEVFFLQYLALAHLKWVPLVADFLLLLQECDYVWKCENTVKTCREQKEQLLFTLCTDWI